MSWCSSRMRSGAASVLGVLLCLGTPGQAAAAGSATTATGTGTYVVTLRDAPTAAYTGGVPGLAATRPAAGQRFDRTRPAVHAYRQWLRARQDAVLDSIGNPAVLYRFTTALDGFAARLDGRQVKRLREHADVVLVERSSKVRVDAVDTPSFLGLAGATGAWAGHGGPADAGRRQVIGVIDTGIWPENPSFAALPQAVPGTSPRLPGFHGACHDAEQWSADDCNDKVVSARYFVRGFGAHRIAAAERLSPRDAQGHGSHTASIAAGNHGVAVNIDGQGFGRSSGMAPAARIASYKACWSAPDPAHDGCATADTVAAIDRAVADGVDVINYSVSGSQDTGDSVSRAFANAAAAGVFVATSAGNQGPQKSTVGHPSPWVTTVAASTHRSFQGSVVLGDGTTLVGSMVSDVPVPATGIVLAGDVPAAGWSEADARLCRAGALDAARTQDRIVVCDRGVIARVAKSAAVAGAGGVGMILANTEPDSTDADLHDVPTVHLDVSDAATVREYVAAQGEAALAALDPHGTEPVLVPQVADFSARGPALPAAGNLLKPDLTAPGVSVLGAVAPTADDGRLWNLASGTSMSAAHVAGLAAFIRGVQPTWTPAMVKSAMMTTAYDVEGTADPLAEGAGHVDAARFLDPGLVYDARPAAWRGFLAGRVPAGDLNLPSIAVGELTGPVRVARRVTNVSDTTEVYDARLTGLSGVAATVTPATLTLKPGQTRRYTLTLRPRVDAAADRFTRGWLTWTGLTHQVRTPVVVRPVTVSAPTEVAGAGADGSVSVQGISGTGHPFELTSTGLAPASPTGISLVPGPFDPRRPVSDEDTFATPIQVPEGTELARFQIGTHNRNDDVDLFVYRGGELVASATGGDAEETITLDAPEPGDYTVYVNAHAAGNHAAATGQLYTWVVSRSGGSPLTLSPTPVDVGPGQSFRYRLSWADLDLTRRWFGAVRYADSGRRTLVSVG